MQAIHSYRARALLLFSCYCASALANGAAAGDVRTDADAAASVRIVDASGEPVAHAVVWFGAGHPVVPPATELVVISQVDKQFIPEVTVIRAGASVAFPNKDSVAHHVYSFAQPNAFEFPLYKTGERPTFRFDHAGIVALGCNIHDSMLGYIVVVDSPYYAQTDADGYASFASMPATGEDIRIWSPRLDPGAPLVVNYSGDRVLALEWRLRAESRPAGGSLAWEDY